MDDNKNMRITTNLAVVSSTKDSSNSSPMNVSSFAEAKKARDRKKASQKIREYAEQLGW